MFVALVAVLMIVVVLFIAFPLLRKTPKPLPLGSEASRGEERFDLEIEKQNLLASLQELETDLSSGKLTQVDYARLKSIDEHRLIEILDRKEAALSAQTAASESAGSSGHLSETELQQNRRRYRIMSLSGALILVLLVAGVASGIYYYQFSKQQEQQQIASTGGGPAAGPMMGGTPPNPLEMVARLERRLRENPDDLQGQMMAGRSYMTLQRTEDAKKAWGKVAELDPGNTEAQYNLGILLIQTTSPDNPKGFEEAMAHLERALMIEPGMPSALFYRGVALIHLKRLDEAEKDWTNALKGLPPGEDADFVRDELRKLKSGNPLS